MSNCPVCGDLGYCESCRLRAAEARVAELTRERDLAFKQRDETRRLLVEWQWERVGGYLGMASMAELAESLWPGEGKQLFPDGR